MPEAEALTTSLVRVDIREVTAPEHGAVAVVTLDDPARRNVLSAAMVRDLVVALDTVEGDERIGAVVLTGSPPAFCAGGDLGGLAAAGDSADSGRSPERELRAIYEGFLRVADCSLPTLAAVNGPAVGAGMNLALACDLRIAGRSARFDTRFLDLGLHPGGGHTFMLTAVAGPQVTAAMVLFGQRLDGAAAVEHGVAFRCVEDDRLVQEAVDVAARAASAPRDLAIRTKKTIRDAAKLVDRSAAVDLELEAQVWSVGQSFFADRLADMRARVSPVKPPS